MVPGLVGAVRLASDRSSPERARVSHMKWFLRRLLVQQLRGPAPGHQIVKIHVRHQDAALVVAVLLRYHQSRYGRPHFLLYEGLGLHSTQIHAFRLPSGSRK